MTRALAACILQCDDVLDKFQGQYGNYPEMIQNSFRRVNDNIRFDTFDVRQGAYPATISDYDFFVITGSKASVYDADPWIQELVSFVVQLDGSSVPLFGICFGHQILALAMNCKVEKADQGWGVGIASNKVSVDGEKIGLAPGTLNMIVSHQDQVLGITGSAQILAASEFCPYFAVKWSDSSISAQGHPEWEKDYSRALMNDRRDRIPPHVIDSGLRSLDKGLDNSRFLAVILDFLCNRKADIER